MNKEILTRGLEKAYDLICSEYDSVFDEDILEDYKSTMEALEDAMKELEDD